MAGTVAAPPVPLPLSEDDFLQLMLVNTTVHNTAHKKILFMVSV
jgi:hypothetical protein